MSQNVKKVFSMLIIFIGFSSMVNAADFKGLNPHIDLPKGCASCHAGHGLPNTPMLIKKGSALCYQCHGSKQQQNTARSLGLLLLSSPMPDVEQSFSKPSHHPLGIVTDLTVMEQKRNMANITQRHSECADCHDPHNPGSVEVYQTGQRRMVRFHERMQYEYELCFKCHANQPLPPYEMDMAKKFNPSNASYHPVEAVGKNKFVPSLIPPWTVSSYVNCTNCHSSDNSIGGVSPHGSIYAPILNRHYFRRDGMPESQYAYALCYQCHNRTSILNNESFLYHREHIVTEKTSCFTCHDSHGSVYYPDLIRFNKDPRFTTVLPNSAGRLDVVFKGRGKVECFLSCHGVNHNPVPNQFTNTTRKTKPLLHPLNYNPGTPAPYFNPFGK